MSWHGFTHSIGKIARGGLTSGLSDFKGFGEDQGLFGGEFGTNFYDPLDLSGTTARKFQAEQAQADRDWQMYMSNTAHQREVADLKAAGLNPILSAGGNGAPVTGGAMAGSASGNPEALSSILNVLVGLKNAKSNAKMAQTTEKDIESQVTQRAAHTANETAETIARIENIKQDIVNKGLEAEAQRLKNEDNKNHGTTGETPPAERIAKHYTYGLVDTRGAINSRIRTEAQHIKNKQKLKQKLGAINYSKLNENQKANYRKMWQEYHKIGKR